MKYRVDPLSPEQLKHILFILLHAPSCLLCPDTAEVGTEASENENWSFRSFLLCLCEITVEQPSTPLMKDVPMKRLLCRSLVLLSKSSQASDTMKLNPVVEMNRLSTNINDSIEFIRMVRV
jgi:hypothetical protein